MSYYAHILSELKSEFTLLVFISLNLSTYVCHL